MPKEIIRQDDLWEMAKVVDNPLRMLCSIRRQSLLYHDFNGLAVNLGQSKYISLPSSNHVAPLAASAYLHDPLTIWEQYLLLFNN